MDYRVERLRTPAECESFAKNAIARNHPELALAARRKAIDLQAATHETSSAVEAEAFAAVYAYEALLTRRNGKKTRATGTWQAVRRYGIIEAIQRAVSAPPDKPGAVTLRDLGLEDLAFEALVMRHEAAFSAAAIEASKARLAKAA
jgi:hypothetical protein